MKKTIYLKRNTDVQLADGYTILHSIAIGGLSVVVGENLQNRDGQFYMCAYRERIGPVFDYHDALASESFAEVMGEFGDRIKERARYASQHEQKMIGLTAEFEYHTKKHVIPITNDMNLEGEVVLIKQEHLDPDRRNVIDRIYLCSDELLKNTADANKRVYVCNNVYTNIPTHWTRLDIEGVIPQKQLPKWAKTALKEQSKAK